MEQTLEIAVEQASRQGASRIHHLKMRIGQMSGVVPEALQFAFEAVIKGTIAQGATLEIERVPTICYCHQCQRKFQPSDFFYECPQCGQFTTDIHSGKEIELSSLEIS